MELRKARMDDLPQIQKPYRAAIAQMERDRIQLWDEAYPAVCFPEDIRQGRMCLLAGAGGILAAFALCAWHPEENGMGWAEPRAQACCLERLVVSPGHRGEGLGSTALQKAVELAKGEGARYLRLYVAEFNSPAIALYRKCGFRQADGRHENVIDDGLSLWEYGFEKEIK